MYIKFLASALIAALLMTGTPAGVSPASGQGAQSTTPAAPAATTLTAEEATAIALEHAKLSAEEVTNLRARPDQDDRVRHWEVHWRSGDWEYDYDISMNGTVLEWDRDYEPRPKADPAPTEPKPAEPKPTEPKPTEPKPTEPKPTEPAPTEPKATEPPKSEKTYLSADEAKAIALKHAGLSAGQVKGLRAEFDRDDGVPVYEIEFRSGKYEYDYEIHAETGKIREFDKEVDD